MSDHDTIRVNFGRFVPLFPIDGVVLLPQQVLPLHIFEPRYRQMIGRALDGSGQIAVGMFEGDRWKQEIHGNPPVRPYVCIGQIVQHETLPDGRYNVLLQGVCRARIISESPPDDERLFRQAMLEPVGVEEELPELPELERLREWIDGELSSGALQKLAVAEHVLEYVRNDSVPTPALLELVGFAIVTDPHQRYRLLSEGDVRRRAGIVRASMEDLDRLVRLAQVQRPDQWPKGLSWN